MNSKKRAYVNATVKKWMGRLELWNWRVRTKFVDMTHTEYGHQEGEDGAVMALTRWEKPYTWAVIEFNTAFPNVHEYDEPELEHTIVHELLHLKFDKIADIVCEEFNEDGPLAIKFNDAIEQCIDQLAQNLTENWK